MNKPEPIISVSGLRGIIGQSLTPTVASRYVAAYAAEIPPGRIVVTRDGRATGSMLADVVASTLCAVGRDVIYGDVAATPTTGRIVRQVAAVGGVQISASHNPLEYNGLKLFGDDGRVLSAAKGEPILQRYSASEASWATHDKIGARTLHEDTTSDHLQAVLAIVDVDRIRKQKFPVVLDANHGAGSVLGRMLLAELGCQATILGDTPDGNFAHLPEPTAVNLTSVGAKITADKAVIGFCQDPDADRLALIDETGHYVGEEFTLALCVEHILSQTKGPVVTNCSTSRMAQTIAEKHVVPFFRSRVGEANVADLMQEKSAVFGGEGNGGPIEPRVGYVRDSFVGMALLLDMMAERGQSLSDLVSALPQYAIHKTTVAVTAESIAPALTALEGHFPAAAASRLDGLRLDWDDKWLLIRASNTEPIVRLVAEANSAAEAEAVCSEAASVIQA
jgi:phosphomannomutase